MAYMFDRLYSLEFQEEGHPALDAWVEFAMRRRLKSRPLRKHDYRELTSRSLVLLYWHIGFFQDDLTALLSTGASVFALSVPGPEPVHLKPTVYAFCKHIGHGLVDYCAPAAFDLFAQAEHADGSSVDARLERILMGHPPYNPAKLQDPVSGRRVLCPKSVFLATPFVGSHYRPFVDGAKAAMRRLGIELRNPADEQKTIAVGAHVAEHINESDFVLANLRYERPNDRRRWNANVYYEIGYAAHAGKPVWGFSFAADRFTMPSDLAGIKHSIYSDENDLALQLIYGLRGVGDGGQ